MLLVPLILYKWSNLILRGKISILMSLGEDLGSGESGLWVAPTELTKEGFVSSAGRQ